MKAIRRIIYRSVTAQFYRQHAGLFLFSFFILVGLNPSAADMLRFHYSVILSILGSWGFFAIAVVIWMLYTMKALLFVRACLKREAYDFLYQLQAINSRRGILFIGELLVTMMAPVLVYGLLVICIAINKSLWQPLLAVMSVLVLLFFAALLLVMQMIRQGKNNQLVKKKKNPGLIKPGLYGMLLQFVFKKQFITLLILKTFSFTLLYFFAETDVQVFDGRMLWLLYLTFLTGHGIIIFRNFHFMESELSFFRNMPVSRWYILLSLLAVYTTLLIPELWALKGMIFIQKNIVEYSWLLLTGPSVLLLVHSLLYSEDNKMEEYLALLFGIWVVFVFFSLSENRWMMPVIASLFGILVFQISYYRYEKKMAAEPDNN